MNITRDRLIKKNREADRQTDRQINGWIDR